MSNIDPRAVVSPSARLGNDVCIGPFAVVGDEVELGDGCILEAHAVARGPSKFGRKNHVHSFAIVGGDPQDLTYTGQRTSLEVGDENEFREFCTVHRGTIKGGGVTRVGSHSLIMAYGHIGHDYLRLDLQAQRRDILRGLHPGKGHEERDARINLLAVPGRDMGRSPRDLA